MNFQQSNNKEKKPQTVGRVDIVEKLHNIFTEELLSCVKKIRLTACKYFKRVISKDEENWINWYQGYELKTKQNPQNPFQQSSFRLDVRKIVIKQNWLDWRIKQKRRPTCLGLNLGWSKFLQLWEGRLSCINRKINLVLGFFFPYVNIFFIPFSKCASGRLITS